MEGETWKGRIDALWDRFATGENVSVLEMFGLEVDESKTETEMQAALKLLEKVQLIYDAMSEFSQNNDLGQDTIANLTEVFERDFPDLFKTLDEGETWGERLTNLMELVGSAANIDLLEAFGLKIDTGDAESQIRSALKVLEKIQMIHDAINELNENKELRQDTIDNLVNTFEKELPDLFRPLEGDETWQSRLQSLFESVASEENMNLLEMFGLSIDEGEVKTQLERALEVLEKAQLLHDALKGVAEDGSILPDTLSQLQKVFGEEFEEYFAALADDETWKERIESVQKAFMSEENVSLLEMFGLVIDEGEVEDQMLQALNALKKVQAIRDAMAEEAKEGWLSDDTLLELRELFYEDFTSIFDPLLDGETWRDRLEKLMAGVGTDENMSLLEMFGLKVDESDAETQMQAALKALEKIQMVHDAINELDENNELGKGTIESLREAFEEELPDLFKPFEDGETWKDRLTQMFEHVASDENMSLLEMFGLKVDDTDVKTQLDKALETIEKAQMLHDAMKKVADEGLISPDELSKLQDAFGAEFENVFSPLTDGETWKERLAELWNAFMTDDRVSLLDMFGLTVEEDVEDQMLKAFDMLDKLQMVRDAIAEGQKEGFISTDTLRGLKEQLGEDFESVFLPLMDGETWQERLNSLWESLATDENMNLLKLFGLQFDDTDAAAEALNEAVRELANAADGDALLDMWNDLPDGIKKSLLEAYPAIQEVLDEIEKRSAETADDVEKNMRNMLEAMKLDEAIDSGKAWSDLDDIMAGLAQGGEEASSAVSALISNMNDAAEAMGAMEAAKAGDADALSHLASMTGFTAEQLQSNMMPAEYAVAAAADQAAWSATYLANALYAAGAVTIDPSGKLNAIGSIEAAASAAGMTVVQFASALAALNGASFKLDIAPDGTGGVVATKVNPIKWKSGGAGSSSKGGSGGGGGGGGGSSSGVSSLIESMLEGMEKASELRDFRRELAQTAQAYHESRGEIQGVILYLEKEKEIVLENIDAVEKYVAQIEKQIEEKKAIIASTKEGSKTYKQAMTDLAELESEHQAYSKELIENKTDVENLTKAVKEQKTTIRDMEIGLRETILKAIEDREEREERMLEGRIEMEEEIMDLLRKRYEAERDELLETQRMKRDALEEEISQIDELLEARKKLADEEDKLREVAELEAQIARISADPTRQKEAVKLQQELNDLREELAWDAAEKEAEAQKESLEQQITSIDDYIEYVEQYYEDLFNNPKKLIEEMRAIIAGTDAEIMEWLNANSEEYQTATEAVQEQMEAGWQQTLDDMNGTVRTHWEEVEEIIAGGADRILEFLKEHSADYKEAGKLQAEAYVDEWKKQLDDLEAAYRKVAEGINSYDYQGGSGDGGSSGGGGGSSGGYSGSSGDGSAAAKPKYHKYEYKDADGNWVTAEHKNVIKESAYEATKDEAIENWSANGVMAGVITRRLRGSTVDNPGNYIRYLGQFKKGGMAYHTGPAWLDGTTTDPERILSPYQTKLFEDLIETLHAVRTVNVRSVLTAQPKMSEQNQGLNIEKIDIYVEKLDGDQDYAEAAEKLMNELYRKVSRGRPIGGIQMR